MRFLFALITLLAGAMPLSADNPRISQLYELMRLSTSVQIMRDEGLQYALESEQVLFEGGTGGNWEGAIHQIYDMERLEPIVSQAFGEALEGVDLTPLINFYQTGTAQRVLELELSARRSFLTPGVEESARTYWRENPEGSAHAEAIRNYIEVNDLIERNVVGAMNSNVLFLRALAAGEPALSEAQILSDVWSEEQAIREDTREWMHAFLTMAYAPLDVDQMQYNLAIWQSDAGRALNNAIFLGFDRMLEQVSGDLGYVAAQMLNQKEL